MSIFFSEYGEYESDQPPFIVIDLSCVAHLGKKKALKIYYRFILMYTYLDTGYKTSQYDRSCINPN